MAGRERTLQRRDMESGDVAHIDDRKADARQRRQLAGEEVAHHAQGHAGVLVERGPRMAPGWMVVRAMFSARA